MRRVFFSKSGEFRLILVSTTELVKGGSSVNSFAAPGAAAKRQYKLISGGCASRTQEHVADSGTVSGGGSDFDRERRTVQYDDIRARVYFWGVRDLLRLAESIACRDGAVLKTGVEPMHPLLGSTVRERFRTNMARGHFLQAIITNGSRGT